MTGFLVGPLGSLTVGGCCYCSEEEALDKIESSWISGLRVMISDGGKRRFLLVYFNAVFKSFVVAEIMSVAAAVGMVSFWGYQETVCPMWTEFVAGIQISWQQ